MDRSRLPPGGRLRDRSQLVRASSDAQPVRLGFHPRVEARLHVALAPCFLAGSIRAPVRAVSCKFGARQCLIQPARARAWVDVVDASGALLEGYERSRLTFCVCDRTRRYWSDRSRSRQADGRRRCWSGLYGLWRRHGGYIQVGRLVDLFLRLRFRASERRYLRLTSFNSVTVMTAAFASLTA